MTATRHARPELVEGRATGRSWFDKLTTSGVLFDRLTMSGVLFDRLTMSGLLAVLTLAHRNARPELVEGRAPGRSWFDKLTTSGVLSTGSP